MNRADLFANLQTIFSSEEIKGRNVPLNLFKGDVIETTQHLSLHLLKRPRAASNTEAKLCRTPILFNKI
jgi:hypothetical protein